GDGKNRRNTVDTLVLLLGDMHGVEGATLDCARDELLNFVNSCLDELEDTRAFLEGPEDFEVNAELATNILDTLAHVLERAEGDSLS
ncbi:hypothetical protein PENTCL1PPCAC_7625, partial [Pristionchus entomophagus]